MLTGSGLFGLMLTTQLGLLSPTLPGVIGARSETERASLRRANPMGSSTNEKQARGSSVPKKKDARKGDSGIFSYRPSEAVKGELKMGVMPLDEAILVLSDRVEAGIGISVSYNPTGHAISVIARDKRLSFGEGVAVAVNHVDLAVGLRVMAYYLNNVNPDYPDQLPSAFVGDFDW